MTLQWTLDKDGLLARFDKENGWEAITRLRAQGFHFGRGHDGRGLYSPSWDRMLGEWLGHHEFILNPSLLHHLKEP